MKHYVTIYIDPLIECFMDFKEKCFINIEDFTHAFLGLTCKHPNELDTIKYEKEITYWDYNERKMKLWRQEEIKWYENFENVEFNDGFYGFAPVESSVSHWGKVFENNQYVLEEI